MLNTAFRRAGMSCITAAVVCLGLGGCATLTTGTAQEILLATEPVDASCRVERNEELIGAVPSTPGRITVTKSPSALTIRCEKRGYEPANGFLFASTEEMTHGNVLLGGLIGMAVDMQSGAINEYPSSIRITLIPTEFESISDRDAFFANLAEETRDRTESDIASIRDGMAACKASPKGKECADAVQARMAQGNAELEQVEQRRRRARIVGRSTE